MPDSTSPITGGWPTAATQPRRATRPRDDHDGQREQDVEGEIGAHADPRGWSPCYEPRVPASRSVSRTPRLNQSSRPPARIMLMPMNAGRMMSTFRCCHVGVDDQRHAGGDERPRDHAAACAARADACPARARATDARIVSSGGCARPSESNTSNCSAGDRCDGGLAERRAPRPANRRGRRSRAPGPRTAGRSRRTPPRSRHPSQTRRTARADDLGPTRRAPRGS